MDKTEFLLRLTTSDRPDSYLKFRVVENMTKFGGSFVKALADCCFKADETNYRKLVNAFEDYFWDYRPEAWEGKNG
jgi:hypothetical protein